MKKKLLVLLGICSISLSVSGVTAWAEAETAVETEAAEDGAEAETETTEDGAAAGTEAAEDGTEAETETAEDGAEAENGSEEAETADASEEVPPVTGDEKISELIDLSTLTEEEDMPDIANMTLAQWNAYEFHQDYATIFSDITSYDHDYTRQLLDAHWSTYLMCTTPNDQVTDEQRAQALLDLHNMRLSAEPVSDVEANRIYLWPEGKVPTITDYTDNSEYAYADDPDFQPYMLECLVDEGTEIKGAVVLAAGGGHNYRSNVEEAYESALALNERGYQCFIVNYRVNPYTDAESALDYARAVRYVRANADKYGVDENQIAGAGFSYGGIVIATEGNSYAGDINASEILESYEPDELDAVSADLNAYLAIYSVSYNEDPEEMQNPNFPPTFFAVGGDDGIWDWVMGSFDKVQEMGITTEIHTFAGVPHAFGAGTHADGTYYENAATWPLLADDFMQNLYSQNEAAETTEAE